MVKEEIAKATISSYFSFIFATFSGFIFQVFLLRYLPPESSGAYFSFLSVFYLANMIFYLGMYDALGYFLPKYPEKRKEYFSTSLVYLIFAGSIVGSICAIFTQGVSAHIIFLTAFLMVVAPLFYTTLHYIKKFKLRAMVSFISGAVKIGLTFIAFIFGFLYFDFVFLILILSNLVFILTFFNFLKNGMVAPLFSRKIFLSMATFAFSLYLVAISDSIFGWLDSFLLRIFWGEQTVAEYNAALTITRNVLLGVVPILAFSVIPTWISAKKELKRKIKTRLLRFGLLMIMFFVSFLSTLSTHILGTLYPRYIEESQVFVFSLLFFVPLAISKFFVAETICEGKTGILLKPIVIGILVVVLLELLLIPVFSKYGAIISVFIGGFGVCLMLLKKLRISGINKTWIIRYAMIFLISALSTSILPYGVWGITFNSPTLTNLFVFVFKSTFFIVILSFLLIVGMDREDKEFLISYAKGAYRRVKSVRLSLFF